MRFIKKSRDVAVLFRAAVFVFILGLVSGCSGIKPYQNTMDKNLFVDVKADRGVGTSLDVYGVDSDCRSDYRGTVRLDKARNEVGIPTDQRLLLVVNFARSSIIFGNSSMAQGTMIKAKSGKVYRAEAVYRDDMYNVEISESDKQNAKDREVEHREFSECKPGELD